MKNLRERLIDFASELQKIGFNEYDSIEQTVDIYLKSINQHTGEARTLEENEAKKEFTQRLLNKIQDIDPEYVYLVNNEFWNLFE